MDPDGNFRRSIPNNARISGPISISYHPNVNGRDIFIFGDRHLSDDGLCNINLFNKEKIDVVEFFDRIFKNFDPEDQTKILDFYLEIPLTTYAPDMIKSLSIPSVKYDLQGPMVRLRNHFKDCFTPSKKCSYQNKIRFFPMDVRQRSKPNRDGGKLTFFSLYSFILRSISDSDAVLKIINESMPPQAKNQMLEKIKHITSLVDINQLIKMTKDYIRIPHRDWEYPKDDIDSFEQYEKPKENIIKTQMDKTSPDIKKHIESFFEKQAKFVIENYDGITEGLTHFWNLMFLSKADQEEAYQSWKNLIRIKSIIMFNIDGLFFDIYSLAKIFDSTTSTDSQEVWIYTGEGHAQAFRRFLIKHLKIVEHSFSIQIAERCQSIITINNHKQQNP